MLRTTRRKISVWALAALVLCGALLAQGDLTAAHAQRRGGRGGFGGSYGGGGGANAQLLAQAERITGDRFGIETSTPRGVRVYAVTRPRPQLLRAIDDGLGELFAVARRRGYRARLNYADYTVFIARPDRMRDSSGAYSPDIAVGAAQYAGSVYDQGGYVYAAGMVLGFQSTSFIIADHDREFTRVANVARYEGEHLVLYHNDPSLYQRTLDHSRGGSHPILQ
ncbi:MAG TPA: hypothetical protein VGV59_20105 [Pyrinomonadaceae bacterium]|nr:hypothetical protein [Pyrinomonadaceae bacterium]